MRKTICNKDRILAPLFGFLIVVTSISDVSGTECKCPPVTPRQGVAVICKNEQGIIIDCSAPAPSLTTIDYKCLPFYRPLGARIIQRQLQCSQECIWQNRRRLEEFSCEIDCGKPSQPHVPFIAKGEKTLRYSWPWHATIFVKDEKKLQNHYICGGTLISENVVLTAAHCLITVRQYPLESYHVVIGSISSNWTENIDDPQAQFFRINKSYVPAEYDQVEQRSDIGLVELDKPIVLSEAVTPACFPFDGDIAKPQEPVVAGEGEVVGYGKNEHGKYELYLKYTRLPVLDAAKCYKILEKRQGIEQFCAGVENGSAVCNGDSGGGMVFKGQGMSRYYVQGIVSHGQLTRGNVKCDGLSYFTNVLHFTKWVADIVDRVGEKYDWMSEETPSTPNSVVPVTPNSVVPVTPADLTNDFASKKGECIENLKQDGADITCTHQGNPINCLNAPSGTIATYACKYRYESTLTSTTRRMCRNGIWTKKKSWKCFLQCGLGLEANHYAHANQSKIMNLPWNVAIYKKSQELGDLEYICGGTLVSDRVVITAAHCVTVSNSKIKRDVDDIILYFGKFYKNIGKAEHEEGVQMRRVEEIYVHEDYNLVLSGFYKSDIAVLVTANDVKMTKNVGPACLPGESRIETTHVGTLIGFERNTTELVKETRIPVVSINECFKSHLALKYILRPTTFCAGYKLNETGTLSCGYGGAGLYFADSYMKWYLYGVTTGSVAKIYGRCEEDFSTTRFVQVQEFVEWINKFLEKSDTE